ncbi:hypothetical protein KY289_013682 [Solanum tuberosum]|nr:hypothetical protein KY289_013682 [Solanum tuberosum]
MFISNNGEARVNCQEEGEILKGPNLIEDEEEVIHHKKDTEEDEDMDYNIQQISKAGDLSPRPTNSLKYGARKGRPVIPLQVKIRSSRERALMEPFQNPLELEQYKRRLGFDKAGVNQNGKIWCFWKDDWVGNIVLDTVQQVTFQFKKNDKEFMVSAVYARCNTVERLELWEELDSIAEHVQCPWIIGGDLNVILDEEEKLGGLDFTINEAIDFASFISRNALLEVQFSGSKCTWWNGRIEKACIFKKLDRILVNQEFLDVFLASEVHHLIRQGLDHTPLHLSCNSDEQIATLEDIIKVREAQLQIHPSADNRVALNKVEADLKNYLRLEEEFWHQKAGMKWFKEGDMNTKFFHSYVKGRRKKLHINEIITEQGVGLKSNSEIGNAAVEYFRDQFAEENGAEDYSMIDHIPECITAEENEHMTKMPELEEVKRVEIIGADITKVVKDLRPISLSSFINKIISRMVHGRMILEIIRDINRRRKDINVVVKLDMAKAYDRVSWIFLTKC